MSSRADVISFLFRAEGGEKTEGGEKVTTTRGDGAHAYPALELAAEERANNAYVAAGGDGTRFGPFENRHDDPADDKSDRTGTRVYYYRHYKTIDKLI